MFGQALLREAARRGYDAIGAARSGGDMICDISDRDRIQKVIASVRPDIIINSAALIVHNLCDEQPHLAYRINGQAVGFMAEAAAAFGARLIQISTDHYYTGDGAAPHAEDHPVTIVNDYAASKFAGEILALTSPHALVVRTNIVGYRHIEGRPAFVEWVIGALEKQESMKLFDDFYTSSIHVKQAAPALFDLVEKDTEGTINLAAREVSNKERFIRAFAARLGREPRDAKAGSCKDMPGAPRAESLGLDVSRAEAILGYRLPALDEVIDSLITEYKEECHEIR